MDHDSGDSRGVAALRAAGVRLISSSEARNQSLSDEEQLSFATAEHCALYSANVRDFALIHRQWLLAPEIPVASFSATSRRCQLATKSGIYCSLQTVSNASPCRTPSSTRPVARWHSGVADSQLATSSGHQHHLAVPRVRQRLERRRQLVQCHRPRHHRRRIDRPVAKCCQRFRVLLRRVPQYELQ